MGRANVRIRNFAGRTSGRIDRTNDERLILDVEWTAICALFAPTILARARLTKGRNRLAYAGPIRDAAETYESTLHHR